MRFRQALLRINGKTHPLQPNRANTFEAIYVDFQVLETASQGTRYSVFLHPKEDLIVQRLEIQFDLSLSPEARFFANGYQSCSESRWMSMEESLPRLHPVARRRFGFLGDDHIPGIPRGRGYLHSWTYTFIARNAINKVDQDQRSGLLLGSLSERTGFTLFLYDHANATLTVRKDMDNLALRHSFPALDFWSGEGAENALFERYFKACEMPSPLAPATFGWTSGSDGLKKISEEFVIKNLESFSAQLPESCKLSGSACFQIGDGWQSTLGDWLSPRPGLSNGMRGMALKIKEKGLEPGLWLAPFVVSPKSEIARRQPSWLLKDANGRLVKVGYNPRWGGWYHVLDFYHDGVREYLSGVFHAIFDKWGFEFLMLDCLFSVALVPPPGKTRGGVMWEAMEFLRHLAGSKSICAAGVPLGACFGLVDYCQTGADIQAAWHRSLPFWSRHREQGDALRSLRNLLGRWQLNGRAFHCQAGAFTLALENQKLSIVQQQTVLTVKALLGQMLVTSDDMGKYSEEQGFELEEAVMLRESKIGTVKEIESDVWKIDFEQGNTPWSAWVNLTKSIKNRTLPNGSPVELRPYETLILKA